MSSANIRAGRVRQAALQRVEENRREAAKIREEAVCIKMRPEAAGWFRNGSPGMSREAAESLIDDVLHDPYSAYDHKLLKQSVRYKRALSEASRASRIATVAAKSDDGMVHLTDNDIAFLQL